MGYIKQRMGKITYPLEDDQGQKLLKMIRGLVNSVINCRNVVFEPWSAAGSTTVCYCPGNYSLFFCFNFQPSAGL